MGLLTASADHATHTTIDRSSSKGWFGNFIEAFRRDAADRRLRDQLAEMDDAMLRDIGIADDELHLIRARDRFTPRAWANRGMGNARWQV